MGLHLACLFKYPHQKEAMKKGNKYTEQEMSDLTIDKLLGEDNTQVNGHYVPDDDDVDDDDDLAEEDDLVLGDDEFAGDEEEYEVDIEDDIDEDDINEDDLVIDTDDEEDDEDDI